MLAYTVKLMDYCSGCTYDSFAAGKGFVQKHPEIPWREMYGLRNRIVHDYEGVNLRLVWEIISEDIPNLRDTLKELT